MFQILFDVKSCLFIFMQYRVFAMSNIQIFIYALHRLKPELPLFDPPLK